MSDEAALLELARAFAARLPARKGEGKKLTVGMRQRVKNRDGNRCVLCKRTVGLTVDHIKPKRDGGTNTMGNLRTLCDACHAARHKRDDP